MILRPPYAPGGYGIRRAWQPKFARPSCEMGQSSAFCEKRAIGIDQLFGSLGLRHVAIRAGRSRLFLVSFHCK